MISISRAGISDCESLASLHAQCFKRAWSQSEFASLLDGPGMFALVAGKGSSKAGFALVRVAADEAEILSIGVPEEHRRRGIGAALLAEAGRLARDAGAIRLFLEVGSQNAAARALYRAFGFREVGKRRDYYQDGSGDGLTMAADLPFTVLGIHPKVD